MTSDDRVAFRYRPHGSLPQPPPNRNMRRQDYPAAQNAASFAQNPTYFAAATSNSASGHKNSTGSYHSRSNGANDGPHGSTYQVSTNATPSNFWDNQGSISAIPSTYVGSAISANAKTLSSQLQASIPASASYVISNDVNLSSASASLQLKQVGSHGFAHQSNRYVAAPNDSVITSQPFSLAASGSVLNSFLSPIQMPYLSSFDPTQCLTAGGLSSTLAPGSLGASLAPSTHSLPLYSSYLEPLLLQQQQQLQLQQQLQASAAASNNYQQYCNVLYDTIMNAFPRSPNQIVPTQTPFGLLPPPWMVYNMSTGGASGLGNFYPPLTPAAA